ncbi:MAG: hypothetical protein A2908_01285 [Candidatus Staskawiczbacteria bacterium RIFCSPLOWO2_01_FULL_38_12b]|uniref:Uncharacterized protein n=1 Tax=Candidatus Staskawiczbacteria bacterium RIFCSPLOWO2_01_FULL_38_12b TaxID=1802214 RepID=A0A1G2IGG3_9BACT|nr:MAG: hypothetical protein A2908_01285 [Candidatus Staskawiczbacteria bacterium RIFCSPLOWO2_01_FULL_38_12b]
MIKVSVATVRCVLFLIRVGAESWSRIPKTLQELDPVADAPQVQPSAPRTGGREFLPSVGNCGLLEFFEGLEKATFQVFQASWKKVADKDGKDLFLLRFMACPAHEINWENRRPFAWMQEACREACGLAGYLVRGYCNPFYEGEKEIPGVHALSVNAIAPDENREERWLVDAQGQPLLGKKPSRRLVITDEGEVKLA